MWHSRGRLTDDTSSGRFIQNHYKEAATAIHTLQTELTNVCMQLGITMEIFEQHFTDEREYLEGLKEPVPATALKTQYVQALNNLSNCR
jgi:N-formylglutamate amidohydrolase